MGLDQYASARRGEPTIDEDGCKLYPDQYELGYWRKHPGLQGFMEDLWIEKGNSGEFNCIDLELGHYDLIKLEEAIKDSELPETSGFFFGEDSDEYYKESTLEFVEQAKLAIDDGYTVIYSSWW